MASKSTPELPSKSTSTNSSFVFKTAAYLVALLAITLALSNPTRSALSRHLSPLFSRPISSIRPLVSHPTSQTRQMASTTSTTTAPSMTISKRPWNARGHADHGWLYTFHTFSFASYYSPQHESFGPLRVINEDRVAAGTGFGTHSHAEFLIWSYLVSGTLEHKDSMGNLENLRRGQVQFTSAGTGIRHSEYNRNSEEECHFLQIWAKPNVKGLKPKYVTRTFGDELKKDRLVRITESVQRHSGKEAEDEAIPMHADVSMSASILAPGKTVVHDLVAEGERKVFLHVVMSGRKQAEKGAKIKIGDVELAEGDGAYVTELKGPGQVEITSTGERPAEFLLFDMGPEGM